MTTTHRWIDRYGHDRDCEKTEDRYDPSCPQCYSDSGQPTVSDAKNLADLCRVLRALPPDDETDWTSLPVFGGDEPESTVGVWSWDETSLLVGTCPDDLCIVSRDEHAEWNTANDKRNP